MEQIKDYLNLYPKVPVAICEPGLEPVPDLLEGYDWVLDKAICERTTWDPSWIKPILRPMYTLTDEEMQKAKFIRESYNNAWQGEAERTRYFLSLYIDLFGLIEAGIALDSTTLPLKIKYE